ncbi:MAG: adenylyl-sulfate kinase [Rhodospirillales bacterium]|nr:adenylyl-sulfate kinase [Rhodospirillales bacterium]
MNNPSGQRSIAAPSHVVERGHALWLFGPPAAGKTTVATALKKALEARDVPVVLFDGDITREIVAQGLGRSIEERKLITHRYSALTSYLTESRIIVILAAINHTNEQRAYARAHHPDGQFGLVWVKTDIDVCMARDPKGLYSRAKKVLAAGNAPEVVGMDIPFEDPTDAEVTVATLDMSPEQAAEKIIAYLIECGSIRTVGD